MKIRQVFRRASLDTVMHAVLAVACVVAIALAIAWPEAVTVIS